MSADPNSQAWRVVLASGRTVEHTGRLTVTDGIVWITRNYPYSGPIEEQVAYPLTSVEWWERLP